jgi:hypothetical protein
MGNHRNLTIVLHYFYAFHRKPKDHSSPFDKLPRPSLGEWFTSNGKFKLVVEKLIERGRAFTITKQHILILN